jgi:hypothetical protein
MANSGSRRSGTCRFNRHTRASADASVNGEAVPESARAGDGRITVTMPDGTMLTLIGVPRLLIAGSDGIGIGTPRQS